MLRQLTVDYFGICDQACTEVIKVFYFLIWLYKLLGSYKVCYKLRADSFN